MPRHFSSHLIHLVFSTKHRDPWLKDGYKIRFNQFITSVIKKRGQKVIRINGMPDHLHILIEMRSSMALADLVRSIKAVSSGWARKNLPGFEQFSWQTGYGAFSVSKSCQHAVANYIRNQERHHRTMDYKDEFQMLLEKHAIPFEEKFLWKE